MAGKFGSRNNKKGTINSLMDKNYPWMIFLLSLMVLLFNPV